MIFMLKHGEGENLPLLLPKLPLSRKSKRHTNQIIGDEFIFEERPANVANILF